METPVDLNTDIRMSRPHLVILGAGASVAAFPNGEKNGNQLPTMDNFIDVVGLEELLPHTKGETRNFEVLYSDLYNNPQYEKLIQKTESKIRSYFSALELPETPTLYDHLILSLREKDIIATFNWDPFLWQACERTHQFITTKVPKLFFLHGNVAIKIDYKNKKKISIYESNTGAQVIPLLYPIKNKDYARNPCIYTEWQAVMHYLQKAYVLTIFGYSAPKSDNEAMKLMQGAWGNNKERVFEEVEIIDIKEEASLIETWDSFIHTHHYRTCRDFYSSLLGKFPRRSCEALYRETMECEFLDYDTKVPWDGDWYELAKWFGERIAYEKS